MFEFQLFEDYLDKYISEIEMKNPSQIKKDYEQFKKYYFELNADDRRERRFLE